MNDVKGYIYIMTNQCMKGLVKIGYAEDVERRRRDLFGTNVAKEFEVYATYQVPARLADKEIHRLIQKLNPSLRANHNREFFEMTPEDAYDILDAIAHITDTTDLLEKRKERIVDYKRNPNHSINRHRFKEIMFSSSLTNKQYSGRTRDDGTLAIFELDTGIEIENNSSPSKMAIIGQAIIDLGEEITPAETLYQRYEKLCKLMHSNDKIDKEIEFYCKSKNAFASGYLRGSNIVVKTGSQINAQPSPYIPEMYMRVRRELITQSIDHG